MRVAVVGMGVIGKRIAGAIARQDDLTLAGVAVRSAGVGMLAQPRLPYYAAVPAAARRLRAAGIEPAGDLADLLSTVDLVLDAGTAGTGAGRYDSYRRAGVVSVFCGGEHDGDLGPLVHPALNPHRARGLRSVRLPSCNTTALGRFVAAAGADQVAELRAVLLRCVTDTDKADKGATNGVSFDIRASHHGADLEALVPGLRARVRAAGVASTCGHVALVQLRLRRPVAAGTMAAIGRAPRLVTLPADRRHHTADIKAEAYHRGDRGDRYELAVQLAVDDPYTVTGWLSLDNEAITIPEALDVIRGCAGHTDADRVRETTDAALTRPSTHDPRAREGSVAQRHSPRGHDAPGR